MADDATKPDRIILSEEQKLFIVQHLACYHTPTEVQTLLKETYALDVSLPAIMRYNPETAAGAKLSEKLLTAFEQARADFQDDTDTLAIAQRNWRLRELLDMYREAKRKKMFQRAAALLEQAAKEMGGMYVKDAASADIDQRIAQLLQALVGQGQEETPRDAGKGR